MMARRREYRYPCYLLGWGDDDYYAEAAWELMSIGGVSVGDPRDYHPHRTDGLDRNLHRLNEADVSAGMRCTCNKCVIRSWA
mgnify:CR=1 FL=1